MKSSPDFWIEFVWLDGHCTFQPVLGSQNEAFSRCAKITREAREGLDYLLLLWGDFKPGTIAKDSQIAASFQGYLVPGGYRWA